MVLVAARVPLFRDVGRAFFAYGLAMRPATRLRQSFREHVLPMVLGFIKDMRYANATTPDSFDRLPRQAVGSFNRQSFDDVVAGKYEDFPFELYEANLSQKAGKSDQTVFKGVVMAFETITPFPGLLVAARRAGPGPQVLSRHVRHGRAGGGPVRRRQAGRGL